VLPPAVAAWDGARPAGRQQGALRPPCCRLSSKDAGRWRKADRAAHRRPLPPGLGETTRGSARPSRQQHRRHDSSAACTRRTRITLYPAVSALFSGARPSPLPRWDPLRPPL